MSASDSESRLEVASSRIRMRDRPESPARSRPLLRSAEALPPRSPRRVVTCSQKIPQIIDARDMAAARISSSVDVGRAERPRFPDVHRKETSPAATRPSCVRYEFSFTVERSTPSTKSARSTARKNAALSPMIVDFPLRRSKRAVNLSRFRTENSRS